jgi:hypothetical protein
MSPGIGGNFLRIFRRTRRPASAATTAAASSAGVPGSGTGATAAEAEDAVGNGTTGAGNAEALPTVKLVPSAIASLLVTISVPSPDTVVPPM